MSSKYPVDIGDQEGIVDAVNYLLSGPSGLGQFFKGFSTYSTGFLTGNFRPPFTNTNLTKSASGEEGEDTIKVYPDASGILVGMEVSGFGIAPGATVVSITVPDSTYAVVTLSAANTAYLDLPVFFAPLNPTYTYVAPITCSSAVRLGDYAFQYNFASTQATVPFTPGMNIVGDGWTDGFYNGSVGSIGVAECTTDYVIFRTSNPYPDQGDDFGGGTVTWSVVTYESPYSDNFKSTDCNGKVLVNGVTDRVFLSAQLNNVIGYEVSSSPADLQYIVSLNRYKGVINDDPTNPEYRFVFDNVIAQEIYDYPALTGTGTLDNIETLFSTVIDSPSPGYYWYILDIMFYITSGEMEVTSSEFGLRSMSAQVVKQ